MVKRKSTSTSKRVCNYHFYTLALYSANRGTSANVYWCVFEYDDTVGESAWVGLLEIDLVICLFSESTQYDTNTAISKILQFAKIF